MNSIRQWWKGKSDHQKSRLLGVRVTDAEEERLEELRQMLRLRSHSEVMRFALQVVECVCSGSTIHADSADEVVAAVKSCLSESEQGPTS